MSFLAKCKGFLADRLSDMTPFYRVLLVLSATLFLTIAIIAGSIVIPSVQSHIEFYNLSVEQLTNGGYYAYVLPASYIVQQGWTKKIWMGLGSFDWQCLYRVTSRWNPVEVRYTDSYGKWLFDIRIEQRDELFFENIPTDMVALDVNWIPSHQGIMYKNSKVNGTVIKVKDSLGMEVVFSSTRLNQNELVNLIKMVDYIGPNKEIVGNPWKKECEGRE